MLPDNSLAIARLDHGWACPARHSTLSMGGQSSGCCALGVDNLHWTAAPGRKAPYQYDHVYLYPLAPRTFRVISAKLSL